ncbi:pyridoxal-phosphate dependent enzyme family protein [Mycobacteroides abscessus]|nr:pyridoxal-phosphate dependent enzyme family protein [Mycobacteroides abscessus]
MELIASGHGYDEAAAAAKADAARTGATLVPAFDDVRTIAGQGTIAAEILDQLDSPPDVVVVPVGGGGCISGIVTYLRERAPEVRVVGVEPAGAACMAAALRARRSGSARPCGSLCRRLCRTGSRGCSISGACRGGGDAHAHDSR